MLKASFDGGGGFIYRTLNQGKSVLICDVIHEEYLNRDLVEDNDTRVISTTLCLHRFHIVTSNSRKLDTESKRDMLIASVFIPSPGLET